MKDWLIEVGIKKMGPSAIRGAILAVTGWIMAHQGMLGPLGVMYDPGNNIITIDLQMLNTALLTSLVAVTAAIIKMVNYHAKKIVLLKTEEINK